MLRIRAGVSKAVEMRVRGDLPIVMLQALDRNGQRLQVELRRRAQSVAKFRDPE
jgi:hypothetical protein